MECQVWYEKVPMRRLRARLVGVADESQSQSQQFGESQLDDVESRSAAFVEQLERRAFRLTVSHAAFQVRPDYGILAVHADLCQSIP